MQNIKGIKEDTSIVKLNISKLHKAVILWTKSTETHIFILYYNYYLIKTVLCIIHVMPKYTSLKFTSTIHPIWCTAVTGSIKNNTVNSIFFLPLRREVLSQHGVDNECLH